MKTTLAEAVEMTVKSYREWTEAGRDGGAERLEIAAGRIARMYRADAYEVERICWDIIDSE